MTAWTRGGGLWTHLKNTAAKDYNLFKQGEALRRATPTAWSRGVDKLPEWGKKGLGYNLASPGFVPNNPGSTVGKVGTKFLSKVPGLGIIVTTFGVGYDIKSGKDPWKAIAGGSSGLAAGAAVGLVVGGPLGVVVGAAVGYGVGALVESFWD